MVRLHRDLSLQLLENKALSWGIIRKSACILAEITIRKSQALTGLSQAQFDYLLPVFTDIYQATQHQKYEEGVKSGTRTRKPGGGFKGKLPTMADKLLFVLYYYKTYPTFD